MFRALMSYVSILTVAVGPLLCCCSGGRFVASGFSAGSVAESGTAGRSCCGRQMAAPAAPAPDAERVACHGHEGGPKKPCTCQTSRADFTTAPTSPRTDLDHVQDWDWAFGLAPPVDAVDVRAAAGVSDPDRSVPGCFLSTADLLFSHHKLRC